MQPRLFDLFDEVELNNYNDFIDKHKNCKISTVIGDKISIIFTLTGLGLCKSIRCNVCSQEKEITNIEN